MSKVVRAAQALKKEEVTHGGQQRGARTTLPKNCQSRFQWHPCTGPSCQQPLIREFGCRGGVTITVSVKLRENDSSGKHGPGLQIGLSDITVIGFT